MDISFVRNMTKSELAEYISYKYQDNQEIMILIDEFNKLLFDNISLYTKNYSDDDMDEYCEED